MGCKPLCSGSEWNNCVLTGILLKQTNKQASKTNVTGTRQITERSLLCLELHNSVCNIAFPLFLSPSLQKRNSTLCVCVCVSNYGMNKGAATHYADVLMGYCAVSAASKLNIKQCGANNPGVFIMLIQYKLVHVKATSSTVTNLHR